MAGTPLRELLAEFGFRFDQRATRNATSSIAGVIGAARSLGQTLLAGAVARGVVQFVQGMINVGSELDDTAHATGLSATELTEWRYAARLGGVEAAALSGAMGRTALAASQNSPVLRTLGVRTRDVNGQLRRTSDVFEDAGVAIGAMTDTTRRSAVATQLWGRSGRALIPMFLAGRDGVEGLRGEVRRLYGTDLERLAEMSGQAGDEQDRLNLVWDAMKTRLAVFLLPALISTFETAVDLANGFADLTRNSSILQAAFLVLGAAAVVAAVMTVGVWGPPLVLFLAFTGIVLGVIMVVDDLITMFRGGRSVVGDFLDELFGFGTAAAVVDSVTEAFNRLTSGIRETVGFWTDLLGLTGVDPTRAHAAQRGDTLAATRGADATEAISAFEDRRRAAVLAAQRGEHQDPQMLRELFGPEARAREAARRGPSAVATGGGDTTITRTTTVGAIHVDGSGDPIATGRAVQAAIEDAGSDSIDDAAHDLIPAGA